MDQLIDYSASVENVFAKTAALLLPELGLLILVACRHPHRLRMASWIPDWSQNSSLFSSGARYMGVMPRDRLEAHLLQPSTINIPDTLCVQG